MTILLTQLGKISTHGADLQMSKIKSKLCMEVASMWQWSSWWAHSDPKYKVMIKKLCFLKGQQRSKLYIYEGNGKPACLLSVHVSLKSCNYYINFILHVCRVKWLQNAWKCSWDGIITTFIPLETDLNNFSTLTYMSPNIQHVCHLSQLFQPIEQ